MANYKDELDYRRVFCPACGELRINGAEWAVCPNTGTGCPGSRLVPAYTTHELELAWAARLPEALPRRAGSWRYKIKFMKGVWRVVQENSRPRLPQYGETPAPGHVFAWYRTAKGGIVCVREFEPINKDGTCDAESI